MNNLFLVIGDNRSIQTTSDSGCFADTSEFAVAGFLFQLSLNKGNNLAKLSLKKGKLVYFYIINDKLPSCICKNEQSLWFSLDCLFEGPFPERSDFNAAMFVKKWCRYGFGKVIWNKRSNNDTTTENKNQRLDVPIKRSQIIRIERISVGRRGGWVRFFAVLSADNTDARPDYGTQNSQNSQKRAVSK